MTLAISEAEKPPNQRNDGWKPIITNRETAMDGWDSPPGHRPTSKKRSILPTTKAQNFCQRNLKLPAKVQSSSSEKIPAKG